LNEDDSENVLFISTHLYHQNINNSFYPSSGSKVKNTKEDEVEIYPGGILNIPIPANSSNFVWR